MAKQSDKEILQNFLALNISHLHDAANFFNILKREAQDSNKTEILARGAAYHFRELYEELNQSINKLDQLDQEELNLIELIYPLSQINLKNILEIELLQFGINQRIELTDQSKSEQALVSGNFSLLTKVFLNLIENALKYTNSKIKIELIDNYNHWQVKISSYGNSIPEYIVSAINDKQKHLKFGYGLSGTQDILEYHQATAEVISLEDSGSIISINFNKAKNTSNPTATKIKPHKKQNKKPKLILLITLLLALVFGIVNYLKKPNPQTQDFNQLEELIDQQSEDLNINYEDL